MKIQLLSGLHIEFEDLHYLTTDADIVVLAGKIHIKDRGLKWVTITGYMFTCSIPQTTPGANAE